MTWLIWWIQILRQISWNSDSSGDPVECSTSRAQLRLHKARPRLISPCHGAVDSCRRDWKLRLAYTNNVANQQTNVMFHFMSNRPFFALISVFFEKGLGNSVTQLLLKHIVQLLQLLVTCLMEISLSNIIKLHLLRAAWRGNLHATFRILQVEISEHHEKNPASELLWQH